MINTNTMTSDGGGGSASNSTTLLLDQEIYQSKQNTILDKEELLVLDTKAFEMENDVCGTECLVVLWDYWRKLESTGISFYDFSCNELNAILTKVKSSLNTATETTAGALGIDVASVNAKTTIPGGPGVNISAER